MSRTDKTRPGWLIEFFEGTVEHDHRGGECRVLTLDQMRPREMRYSRLYTCRATLGRGYVYTARVYGGSVPRWFVQYVYHNPMRRSARDVLRGAMREYNAGHRPDDSDLEDRWEPPVLSEGSAAYWW